ncbi:MAG: sigma-54 interaction domain-containing protein [Pseudomonadota bacterium]
MESTFHTDAALPYASFELPRGRAAGGRFGSRRDDDGLGALIGASEPMRRLFDLIERVAPTDATVFIVGESGTGKELVAGTMHDLSPRADGPFWAVNCGAIPENLIEAELFGHEKGSFTGASGTRKGLFELADGGTLFLDEVTEMRPEMQVRLLRVLETRSFCRVGGEKPIEVDVRIVAATNRDPAQAVAEGRLRQDLYYRLAVFPLRIPALRERGDDAVLLAQRFVEALNQSYGSDKRLAADACAALAAHAWPGNVRELRNAVERAFILAERDVRIEPPPAAARGRDAIACNPLAVDMPLAEMERLMIFAALERHNGNKSKAAQALGVSVKTLYNRLNAYRSAAAAPAA